MALTDPFVIPNGVILTTLSELPELVRRSIDGEDGDLVISRANSRAYAKVLGADAAALVNEFRNPSTIGEAVARFSRTVNAAAERLLEESLPMLQSLITAGLLVPAASPTAAAIEPSIPQGVTLNGWRVIRCLQSMEDSEIYQVRSPLGHFGALKTARTGHAFSAATIEREAAILADLAEVAPRLLELENYNPRPYLVSEWIPGVDALTAYNEIRHENNLEPHRRVLSLSSAILRAYARLHDQGVIHGDVHYRNLLVDRNGAVKIIDFGQARRAAPDEEFVPRAGVGFFLEPEFATAVRRGGQPPASTFLGEQYALAALIYLLVTGTNYLDFIVERNEMLRQIEEEPMVSFERRGIASRREVEGVLARALSKRPEHRFASVAEFAQAWETIGAATQPAKDAHVDLSQLDKIHCTLRKECTIGGSLLYAGRIAAPSASIAYGSAGVACMLHRIACASDDGEALAAADLWSTRATSEIGLADAFLARDFEITPGSTSLYHGAAGVHAIAVLLAHARGDPTTAAAATQAFLEVCEDPCDRLELALGRSGVLLGTALLLKSFDDASHASGGTPARAQLHETGNTIFADIQTQIELYPALTASPPLSALGIAHGWAGVLYALLCWCGASGERVSATIVNRLEELADLAEPAGRGLQWPIDLASGSIPFGPGWCNGSAGYVFLWTQAYHATGEPRYLGLADGAAWNAWETPSALASLCCGAAGQAYSLLNFYRVSRDAIWLRRARILAARAGVLSRQHRASYKTDSLHWRTLGLHKGEAAIAALAADLQRPDDACMPMFEL